MTKINEDFTLHAGEPRTLTIPITSNGVAVDVTGYTATWVLSASDEFTSPVLTKTVGSGITLNSTSGFIVAMDAADSSALAGKYYHKLTATDGNSVPSVVTTGQVTIY